MLHNNVCYIKVCPNIGSYEKKHCGIADRFNMSHFTLIGAIFFHIKYVGKNTFSPAISDISYITFFLY